jgi:hypothetical protein
LIQAEGPKPPSRMHSWKEGLKQRGRPAKRKMDALDFLDARGHVLIGG